MNHNIDFLPQFDGAYALFLHLNLGATVGVGRLGIFSFLAGDYIYLGSACGPGGLRSRLGRHLRCGNRLHWHIDYLRQCADVVGYAYVRHDKDNLLPHHPPLECLWSQALCQLPEVSVPVSGFGASDCNHGCPSHLLYSQSLEMKRDVILETLSAHARGEVTCLLH